MTCDSCGHEVPTDARFCPSCGSALAERVEAGEDVNTGTEQADASEAPPPAPRSKRPTVVTVLGNVLAVAAGGALGYVVGRLIVGVM